MKMSEIIDKYCLEGEKFERYIKWSGIPYKEVASLFGNDIEIADSYVTDAVEAFWEDNEQKELERKEREEQWEKDLLRDAEESKIRRKATAQMLISSGFSFEGYKIVKYSGYISGDDATQIPRSGVFGGNNGENLTQALVRIRRQALQELKDAAYELGCNAVIGVDFDYITLEPETANIGGGTLYEPYIICVTANGNAVVVEKE